MTESFYEVLGVAPDADDDAIKQAYREKLKETHPDVNDDPDADDRTKRLLEAKETLLDSDERERYDRVGHEAYVGEGHGPIGATGDTGATARGTGDNSGYDPGWSSRSADEDRGPTNDRAGPWERRARERRARERVETDADWARGEGFDIGGGGSTSSGGGATTGTSGTTGTGDTGTAEGVSTPSWSDSRFDTNVEPGDVQNRKSWLTVGESPTTVVAAFVLYPILVAGSLFPPFPLWVNIVVATCTVTVIAALQSMPGVGVAVFSGWAIAGTLGLLVAGVHPLSLLAFIVLGATWLPLGLSMLTYWILRT